MKTEDLLSKIETKIKDKTLDYKIIFNFFEKMEDKLQINKGIDFEINEDLFCKTKAFINIYNTHHDDYHYLED